MDLTNVITFILIAAGLYLVAGLFFCAALLKSGLSTLDPGTRNSEIGFRLLIIPGILVLWPLVWKKWKRSHRS
jgi:hypothetical protein